jgi:hypothetical protein
MILHKLSDYVPGLRDLVTVTVASILGGVISFGIFAWIHPADPSPKPIPSHDPRFVTLGRVYLTQLGKAYAGAWEDGATLLDSGQGLSTALETVRKSWESNRAQLFEQVATPEFGKLIPESSKDSDILPQARSTLAAAWRGFALGLRR